jgi:hypothetical protein
MDLSSILLVNPVCDHTGQSRLYRRKREQDAEHDQKETGEQKKTDYYIFQASDMIYF